MDTFAYIKRSKGNTRYAVSYFDKSDFSFGPNGTINIVILRANSEESAKLKASEFWFGHQSPESVLSVLEDQGDIVCTITELVTFKMPKDDNKEGTKAN